MLVKGAHGVIRGQQIKNNNYALDFNTDKMYTLDFAARKNDNFLQHLLQRHEHETMAELRFIPVCANYI